MHFLDDNRNYKKYDPDSYLESFGKLSRQFESAWQAAQFENLGFEGDKVKNIVFAGMGGSNLAAYIVESLSPLLLRTPFIISANYRLPGFADKNTLVILSSYSGDTEEILSCAKDAKLRSCKIVVIASGGKLRAFAHSEHLPLIELDEKYNPSRSPRAGIGLSLGAVIGLLVRLRPDSAKYFDTKEIVRTIERVMDLSAQTKDTADNPAKSLAMKHHGQGVIFLSANHLTGTGKYTCNFLNETAKTYSAQYIFPDLNHHLLEGFSYPTGLKDDVSLIILNSNLYPEVIRKRVAITRDILIKQKYHVTVLRPETTDLVLQVFESLAFLMMFGYYLSIVNKVNPGVTPWVDYLKKQLSSST